MITRAIVYAPDPASLDVAALPIAGRSVLFHALMVARRAGIERLGVPSRLRTPALRSTLRAYPDLERAVVWLDAATAPWGGTSAGQSGGGAVAGPVLLLPAVALMEPGTLHGLLVAAKRAQGAALEESKGTSLPVVVVPPEVVARLWPSLTTGAPIGAELDHHLRAVDVSFVQGSALFMPISDASLSREAEVALYRRLGIAADSRIDVLVHRRLSRYLTRLLVRSSLTPNHVTFVSLLVGVAAAVAFWTAEGPGRALLGVVLYLISVVVDHSDGEVARLTYQESAAGGRFDFACDTIVHGLLVLALAATAERFAPGGAMWLGVVGAFGVVMSALVARYVPTTPGALGTLLRGLGNRDLFYAMLVGFAIALAAVPAGLPWIIAVLALGSHSYWVAAVLGRLRW